MGGRSLRAGRERPHARRVALLNDDARRVAAVDAIAGFGLDGRVVGVERHRGGHIHESWLVTTSQRRYLAQRLNTAVFTDLEALDHNVRAVVACVGPPVRLLPSAPASEWRVWEYVEHTRAATAADAEEVGRAFGRLHRRLDDLDPATLRPVLPHLHDPARHRQRLADSVRADRAGRAEESAGVSDDLRAFDGLAAAPAAWLPPSVPWSVIHRDAKAANTLVDVASGRSVCVIDFDTVAVGSRLWDFGDLVRSVAATADEDESDPSLVRVDREQFAALLRGYAVEGPRLTTAEADAIVVAAMVVTYEQAVRFLTDHLDGDRYYGAVRPQQNLDRAKNQAALLSSLDEQRDELAAMIRPQ